jgi:hypothetical protein
MDDMARATATAAIFLIAILLLLCVCVCVPLFFLKRTLRYKKNHFFFGGDRNFDEHPLKFYLIFISVCTCCIPLTISWMIATEIFFGLGEGSNIGYGASPTPPELTHTPELLTSARLFLNFVSKITI